MRLLFWNINRQEPLTQLRNLCRHYAPDVLGLAECLMSPAVVLTAINADQRGRYSLVMSGERVHIYSTVPDDCIRSIEIDLPNRFLGLCEIHTPIIPSTLIGVAHLRSPCHANEATRHDLATKVVGVISGQEASLGHQRTILIGDFNMLGHEHGMAGFSGFNVTPYRDVVVRTKGTRRFDGERKSFFFGPLPRVAPTTDGLSTLCSASYFCKTGQTVEHYWYPFDRALVRPLLADRFSDDQLQVLTYDGEESLVRRNGVPDPRISDHLPVCLDIALEEM